MQPTAMEETVSSDPENSSTTSSNEKRKSSKPVMEKRRRARINNSLNELKEILLESMKKDSTRHSKLEKADILEMTVKHLKNVERQRLSVAISIDPTVVDKYKSGFNECRNEVMRFLSTCEGVNVDVRTRLLDHLAHCHQSLSSSANSFPRDVFGDQSTRRSPIKLAPCASQGQMHISAINLDHPHQTFQMQLPVSTANIQIPSNMSSVSGMTLNPTRQANAAPVTPVLLKGNLQIAPKQSPTQGNITVIMPSSQLGQATAYLSPVSIANQYQTVELVAARPLEVNYNVPDAPVLTLQQTEACSSSTAGRQLPQTNKASGKMEGSMDQIKNETTFTTSKKQNTLKRKGKKQTIKESKKTKLSKSNQQSSSIINRSLSSNDEGASPDKLMTSSSHDAIIGKHNKITQACNVTDVNNNVVGVVESKVDCIPSEMNLPQDDKSKSQNMFFREDIENDVSPWRPWSFGKASNDVPPVSECSK